MRAVRRVFTRGLQFICLCAIAIVARFAKRPIDVGLGPVGIINNVYHKRALVAHGYRVETFARQVSFITHDFDHRVDRMYRKFPPFVRQLLVFNWIVRRYRCLYMYFDGGFLFDLAYLRNVEPFLYRLSGVATVVMPYGGDVMLLEQTPGLYYRAAFAEQYPLFRFQQPQTRAQVKRWSLAADHVICGCDWVDYVRYWDTLMLAHFSIELQPEQDLPQSPPTVGPFRIMHAPNHRLLKGTEALINAVATLQAEGYDIDLQILEGRPNNEILAALRDADLVVDQLVIGWYAMLALEAMSHAKPVICYMRPDLVRLFVDHGLINADEVPLISADRGTITDVLRDCIERRDEMPKIGRRCYDYVRRHHSVEAVGRVFDRINRSLGIDPSGS